MRCRPPALTRPSPGQPLQQRIQRQVRQVTSHQPGPELAQHAGIKARIIQLQAERVLPRHPVADRLSGLPVGQVLRKLQNAGHHQLARGDPRPARTPNAAANRASAFTSPSSSRIRIARFPCRDDERAIFAVSSGTSGQGRGCIDMTTSFCGQAKGQDEEQHDRAKDHELQARHCSGSAAACRRISQQGPTGVRARFFTLAVHLVLRRFLTRRIVVDLCPGWPARGGDGPRRPHRRTPPAGHQRPRRRGSGWRPGRVSLAWA